MTDEIIVFNVEKVKKEKEEQKKKDEEKKAEDTKVIALLNAPEDVDDETDISDSPFDSDFNNVIDLKNEIEKKNAVDEKSFYEEVKEDDYTNEFFDESNWPDGYLPVTLYDRVIKKLREKFNDLREDLEYAGIINNKNKQSNVFYSLEELESEFDDSEIFTN